MLLRTGNRTFGRGAPLHAGRVVLRVERRGDAARVLCSADGQEWFGVGEMTFPTHAAQVVGLHAIGIIDRILWPGAYPQGTAIRFGG